jgi:hypothetical protein
MTVAEEGTTHVTAEPSSSARLRDAVLSIDLQFYKGSIYKLRWGSPGGLDHAIPAYRDALRTLGEVRWPADLQEDVASLTDYLEKYIHVLEIQDVTNASGLFSPMTSTFERIRDKVRVLPD